MSVSSQALSVGYVTSVLALAGWIIPSPMLTGFGIANYPAWPLVLVANLLLCFAVSAVTAGRLRTGTLLLALPVALGIATLIEFLTGIDLALDRLLFPESVAAVHIPDPGRPALIPAVFMVLFPVLIALLQNRRAWADAVILSLGAFLIGLSVMPVTLLTLGVAPMRLPVRLLSALPCAIASIAMTVAALHWRSHHLRVGMLAWGTPAAKAAGIALPIVAGVPALLLPLGDQINAWLHVPALAVEIFIAALSLSIFVLLLAAAIGRIAADHAALLRSEAQMAIAVEAHGIGLFEWRLETNELRWSPTSERQLGLAPRTIRTIEDWKRLVGPEEASRIMEEMLQHAERGADHYAFRYSIAAADGRVRILKGTARFFYDKAGNLLRSLGAQLDVTESEERTAELAAREAQMRSILETVPDAMVVIDDKGTVATFSAAAERMLGYTADQVIGRNVAMLMPDMQGLRHDGYLARYLDTGERRIIGHPRQVAARRADGGEVPVELNVGEARVGDRRFFTGFLRDMSERQAAQRRLGSLLDDYAHAARLSAMGELAAGLAHELNQPLAAGTNYLGTARIVAAKLPDGAAVVDLIRSATDQLLRVGEIIRRLRDFIARGEGDMRAESLEETVHESVALGLIGSAAAHVTAKVMLDPQAAIMVADRVQVQQVLVNLLRNAAEAVRGGPPDRREITIASRPIGDDMLEVSVRDHGPGLPDMIINQLYKPFISTKGNHGLGVGLSICRRIVEAHRGTITAQNLTDGGACIAFTLPRLEHADQEREDA